MFKERNHIKVFVSSTVYDFECEHSDLTYSDIKESGHTAHCKYCEYKKEEAHSYVGSNTQCAQCGYGTEADIRTLSFYQTATTSQTDYMASGTPYVQGKTIALPACTQVPTDCEFVGWLKQGSTPASIETADGEILLQPGDEYIVDGSETFYARTAISTPAHGYGNPTMQMSHSM